MAYAAHWGNGPQPGAPYARDARASLAPGGRGRARGERPRRAAGAEFAGYAREQVKRRDVVSEKMDMP